MTEAALPTGLGLDFVTGLGTQFIGQFDDELVKKLFIELAKRFRATAHRFGIEFEISIDGEAIE